MTIRTECKPFHGLRIEVYTSVRFDQVLARLRAQMGRASVQEVVALAKTSITEAEYAREVEKRFVGESDFMLFAELDHGGWLPKFGINRRTVRWIFGNPLIAVTMIRHDITAGLFAPVELLITEAENGQGTALTYVRPSTLMVIADNPPLLAAAKALMKSTTLLSPKRQPREPGKLDGLFKADGDNQANDDGGDGGWGIC
jgi:hypothetical protein